MEITDGQNEETQTCFIILCHVLCISEKGNLMNIPI